MPKLLYTCRLFLSLALLVLPLPAKAGLLIAGSGDTGALARPSLATMTLAAALGADYLVLPVALTADGYPVVFQPLTLEGSTDVEQVFPEKKRNDGSYYPIDFTLEQLRRLRLRHPAMAKTPPLDDTIATLPEHLALARRLEAILAHPIGLILEPRAPWWYRQEGKELSRALLIAVQAENYTWPRDKIFLQCYDPEELQLLHRQLLPELAMNLPLIQLIGSNDGDETRHKNALGSLEPYNYDWLFTNVGLKFVASYAMALALPAVHFADPNGRVLPLPPGYLDEARRHGLQLLALTHAVDDQLEMLLAQGVIDGLYSDDLSAIKRLQVPAVNPQAQAAPPQPTAEMPDPAPPSPADDLPPFFRELKLARPPLSQSQDDSPLDAPNQ